MNEAARDRQVARETVRPAAECHHCTPGADALLEEIEAAQTLAATSTDGLLTAFAAVTHRIDVAKRDRYNVAPSRGGRLEDWEAAKERVKDLRAERDLIRAEILTRTGDL